jgi:hypothetical protein
MTWVGTVGLTEWGSSQLSNILNGEYFPREQDFKITYTIREPWVAATHDVGVMTCDPDEPTTCTFPGRYGFGSYSGVGAVTAVFETGGYQISLGEGLIYQHLLPDDQLEFRIEAIGSVLTPFNYAPQSRFRIGYSTGPLGGLGVTYDWRTMNQATITDLITQTDNNISSVYFSNPATGGLSWGYLNLTGGWIRTSVPEPTTWAIFICGFGFAGVALRGRRQALL